jgi:hypothetical protein
MKNSIRDLEKQLDKLEAKCLHSGRRPGEYWTVWLDEKALADRAPRWRGVANLDRFRPFA